MKIQPSIPFAAFLTLIFAVTLFAQSPLITSPANLSQFPSVEKIRLATKGTDDVDSHARFMVALWRINGMMIRDLLMAPNGGMYNLPAAAAPIQEQYRRALSRYSIDEAPPAIRDPRYRQIEAKYEADPAFLDFLLVQLFSPKFRTEYYAWVRKPVPPLTATGVAANKGASPDTSIAKALAAKVDISIVGLKFGDPVRLPDCPLLQLAPLTQNCLMAFFDLAKDMVKEYGGENTIPDDVRDVRLAPAHCPSWVTNCQAYITVHDDKLDSVALFTNGRDSAGPVTRDLTAKYGKPTRVKASIITPDTGNPFNISTPEWDLPGLRVRYEIVRSEEDSDRIHTKEGIVRIMTETEHQRRLNKQKEPVKSKL